MPAKTFSLQIGEAAPLIQGNNPPELQIPIFAHTSVFSVGDQVLSGTKIATSRKSGVGDIHAPLAGHIEAIEKDRIVLKVQDTAKEPPSIPPTDGQEFKQWLQGMGIDVSRLYKADILIINGIPPEPGISVYDCLLRDYRTTLELGLKKIQQLIVPNQTILATARGNVMNAFEGCSAFHVAPLYPNGLDQLVIKAITGKEVLLGRQDPEVTILSVKDLYCIGRVLETGQPLTETVLTSLGRNLLVKIGTPVGWLAQEMDISIFPHDKVLLGGLLRGICALNLQQGITKETIGVSFLRPNKTYRTTHNFCLGCGECERHCPSRIMPGMISRCSEFKQYERAEDFHIHSCIECGLCSYWCKAQRPLLQYIRHAKYEIALLRTHSKHISQDSPEPKEGDNR